eukprot:TRINITY_DN2615_c0_g1_i1.p1 TRINITY_DN2615_c0_g1~~TRINITY_DN2615_c0_g1_i1.p1  ORF type:complete len:938 (+),score=270.66 TRINITY_DN2615_c0_g1_i1:188-3001(+)
MSNPLDILKSLLALGCRKDEAEIALKINNNDINTALDFILQSTFPQKEIFNSLKEWQRILGFIPEDLALNRETELSAKESDVAAGLTNLERKQRDGKAPVGLKNMGNTCYLNCLLQVYFMLPLFVKRVFEFEEYEEEEALRAKVEYEDKERTLMASLQRLFARLVHSEKRYIEPTEVFKSLSDINDKPFSVSEQKDVGEFNAFFLSKVGTIFGKSFDSSKILGRRPVEAEKSFEDDFYGEFDIVTSASESDRTGITLSEIKEFIQVIVNAREKDIYEGWEVNYFNTEIEGYRTPARCVAKAEQEWWITKLPSVLFLVIQRCHYDATSRSVEKIANPVQFDKVIYLDRFMQRYREKSRAIRAETRKYKSKIKELEAALEKYKEFGASKLDIEKVLETSLYFLTNQSEYMATEESKDVKALSPTEIGSLGHNPTQFKELAEIISQYSKTINEQLKKMEEQLAYYKSKVANSYSDMEKHPYNLHSVIVHAGNPNSGHYFAYVHDEGSGKWRRYSDTRVTEVTEAEVMKVSVGEEHSSISAYFLVYVAATSGWKGSPKFVQHRLSNPGGKSVEIADYYMSILPCRLQQDVVKENEEFRMEIEGCRAEKVVRKLGRLYVGRYEKLGELDGGVVPESIFRTFHFVSRLKAESSPYLRWELMNCTLKELHSSIGIPQLERTDPILAKLEKHFLKEYRNAPENLLLSESEFKQLDILRNIFENEVTEYAIRDYLLAELLGKNWVEAYKAVCYYFENKLHKIDNVKKDIADIANMLSLILSSETNKFLMKKEPKKVLKYAGMNSYLCTFVIGANDPHSQFVVLRLKQIQCEGPLSFFAPRQLTLLAQYIKDIEENDLSVKECYEESKKLKAAIENEVKKGFEWRGSWKKMEKEWRLKQERKLNFMKEHEMWAEIHEKLEKGVKVTIEEAYEMEKIIGIDFKLALTN